MANAHRQFVSTSRQSISVLSVSNSLIYKSFLQNATVTISSDGLTASLALAGETMNVKITNPTDQNLKFETLQPVR